MASELLNTANSRLALPQTQALTSTTFCPPPLDGSLTIPELLEWHYTRSTNHPVFMYDDAGTIKTLYWSDWYPAINRAARYVRDNFSLSEPATPADRPVIAILANSGQYKSVNM